MEGDADKFGCEFLFEKFWRSLDKRTAQGKSIRDEWNPGCDRLKLWQAHVKLVSPDCCAVKELSDLPGMTTWSHNPLVDRKDETTGYQLSKAEDAREDRWISVGVR